MIAPYAPDAIAKMFQSIAPPYRITETLERKIVYEFWRVSSIHRSDIHNKQIKKELAMITVDKSSQTFNLAYYPLDKNAQFMTHLPLSDLTKVVADLKLAGF